MSVDVRRRAKGGTENVRSFVPFFPDGLPHGIVKEAFYANTPKDQQIRAFTNL